MAGRWRIAGMAVMTVAFMVACGDNAGDVESAVRRDTARVVAPPPRAPDTLPTGVTADMLARGEQQFKAGVCIACHGQDAGGTPIAPNLKDFEWLNTDGSYQGIQDVIRSGVAEPKEHPGAMQPMGGTKLTDEQISEIAAYLVSIRGRF